MRKSGVVEEYLRVIKDMYDDGTTTVKCNRNDEPFLICYCNGQLNRWDNDVFR